MRLVLFLLVLAPAAARAQDGTGPEAGPGAEGGGGPDAASEAAVEDEGVPDAASEAAVEGEGAPADVPPPDPEAEARHAEALSRFDDAAVLFERGDYQGALAEMTLVYELLSGRPDQYVVFYNLGRIYEELHRYDRAIELYERYLRDSPADGPDRPDAEASLRRLERLLGTLVVHSDVAAEVWISGALVGEAPGEIRVPAGAHVLELRAAGYETFQREIEIAARTRVELDAPLVRLSDVHGISPAFFAVTASATVVALGIGLGLGLWASQLHGEGTCLDRDVSCPAGYDPMVATNRIRDVAIGADLLYVTTALFAATSVVLAFVTDWDGSPPAASSERALLVLPSVAPSGAGLVALGSF